MLHYSGVYARKETRRSCPRRDTIPIAANGRSSHHRDARVHIRHIIRTPRPPMKIHPVPFVRATSTSRQQKSPPRGTRARTTHPAGAHVAWRTNTPPLTVEKPNTAERVNLFSIKAVDAMRCLSIRPVTRRPSPISAKHTLQKFWAFCRKGHARSSRRPAFASSSPSRTTAPWGAHPSSTRISRYSGFRSQRAVSRICSKMRSPFMQNGNARFWTT